MNVPTELHRVASDLKVLASLYTKLADENPDLAAKIRGVVTETSPLVEEALEKAFTVKTEKGTPTTAGRQAGGKASLGGTNLQASKGALGR